MSDSNRKPLGIVPCVMELAGQPSSSRLEMKLIRAFKPDGQKEIEIQFDVNWPGIVSVKFDWNEFLKVASQSSGIDG